MDLSNFIGGIVGGALSSSVIATIAAFLARTAKERWIEGVKAQYDKELEQLKATLEKDQKTLQAKLDQSTYVTQSQYDLELSAYKELWYAMSELRERLKEFFGLYAHGSQTKAMIGDEAWNAKVKKADDDLSKAYDNAILVSERHAPFYEKSIQSETRTTTTHSAQFFLRLGQEKLPSIEEFEINVSLICAGVEKIDSLIRERLSSVRLAR